MAQIKTALELALERTKDIQSDHSSLVSKEFRERGMRLLAKAEADPSLDIAAELAKYTGEQLSWFRQGMKQNLLSYVALPTSPEALDRFRSVEHCFDILSDQPKQIKAVLANLTDLFQKYLQNREQMIQAVRQQFEPLLRQKEDQAARQTGRRVRINPEADPEYVAFLHKNLESLQKQFNQLIDQSRQKIDQLLNP